MNDQFYAVFHGPAAADSQKMGLAVQINCFNLL